MADKTNDQLTTLAQLLATDRVPVGQGTQLYTVTAAIAKAYFTSGFVAGPASAVDNQVVTFDSTTGKVVQGNNATTFEDDDSMKMNPIASPTYAEGKVFYDNVKKALSYYNDKADVTVNLGQEVLLLVENQTGGLLTNGTVVSPDMTTIITKADSSSRDKCRIIAVLTHDIADGETGYATKLGQVGALDTSAYPVGTVLYLSATTPGTFTSTRPDDGHYSVIVGVVDVQHATAGVITVDTRSTDTTVEITDTNGFPSDQRTSTTLAFVDGTRTFTIAPTGTDFHFYELGDKYEKTGGEDLVISDVEGLHVLYYDSGVLTSQANPSVGEIDALIRTKCLIAYIYWDATNSTSSYFADERHGISMSPVTHAYLHFTRGAQYLYGLGLGDFNVDAGSVDATSAQFSTAIGSFADEDIMTDIPAVGPTVGLPIYYLEGATGLLRRTTQAGFSIKAGVGTGNPLRNERTGVIWQTTEVGNNDYVLYHIFAINGYSGKDTMVSIMGQAVYGTVGQARAGATTEITNILVRFPFEEIVPVGTIIVQANTGYANDVNSRLRSDGDGNDYLDWRSTELAQGANPSDHNNLTNLEYAQDGVSRGHVNDQAQTFKGVKEFADYPIVPDEAYGASWDASLEIPTKNAVYDQMQLRVAIADIIDNVTSTATDQPLSANQGKVLKDLIDLLQGSLVPQGAWDADTNSPDITGASVTGYFRIVSVAGTTDLGGITDWEINDWAVKTATGWAKIDNTANVLSVNGATGVVVLDTSDIAATTDKNYVTDAEKTVLGNTSGTNSGDNAVNSSALALDQTTPQTITGGQPIQNTLTASEIVATDGSKKLQSLPVATYPSLAELAYLKGVTSAIQTQIGSKLSLAGGTMTGKIGTAGSSEVAKTYTPGSGAQSVEIDCSLNNIHEVTGNAGGTALTFTITGATNSQVFIVSILQGASTLSTITARFATVRRAGGTAPTLTATASKRDTFGFRRTGANTYDGFIIGQNC